MTHASQSSSPVINTGTNTGCPAQDQRGYARDATCDKGAYEYGASAPPPPSTTPITTAYYYAGAALIALREITATGNTLYFVHTDHLGSISAVTNADGTAVVGRQYYLPYGGTRGDVVSLPTDRAFTGQVRDATGLDYFRARYFSSSLGRFISADSIVPGAGNPQALNRYAFVLGNPLKYTDPTGHYYCTGGELDAAACVTWVEGMLNDLRASGATGADLAKRFRDRDAALMKTKIACGYGNCTVNHPGIQFDFAALVPGGMVTGNTVFLNDRYASSPLSDWDLGLVGHELTHLLKQDDYRNTTRGEAEAYADQARILKDLGKDPLDVMKLALKTNVNSATDLETFKKELVAFALDLGALAWPSAGVYLVEPTGAPQKPVPPSTPVRPRPGQTPQ